MFNMAGKSAALAAGFFLIILASFGAESSERVPDGLVYTELKKKLVQGITGMLTCRFSGEPFAVYWRKGSDIDNLSPIILWDDQGTIAGPGYDDGSCNIDVNSYSLVIKNVSVTDAGRFYCIVSNHLGILVDNYTDVFVVDTALETKSHLTLHMRPTLPGILQCIVHIRPRTVTWTKKCMVSSSNETLVTFDNNGTFISRRGVGFDQETFNITKDYSLIINDVQVQSEGLYVCAVTDFDTGVTFRAETLVNVAAQPLKPFPSILECPTDSSDPGYCSIFVNVETTLTCQVREYYPDINLQFFHGSKAVEKLLNTSEINNTDGTKTKRIEIAARESKELYTCVAFNIPGTHGNVSTSVLLHSEVKFTKTVLVILVVLVVLLASVILIVSAVCTIRKRRPNAEKKNANRTNNSRAEQLELKASNSSAEQLKLKEIDADEKGITKEELLVLEQDVNMAMRQHCSRMSRLLDRNTTLIADKIIKENKTALFDFLQMLTDCLHNLKCDDIGKKTTQQDDDKDHYWPSDEELDSISRHLNKESVENICKKLKIDYTSDDASDKGKGFENLREWRKFVAKRSVEDKHQQLSEVLKLNNPKALLPPLKGRYIYKTELVDMAFYLLIHDVLPVAEKWGINATKLVSYKSPFQPFFLEIGTINVLSKLLKKIIAGNINFFVDKKEHIRSFFFGGLKLYRNVSIYGMIAYHMSYGELFCILEVMMQNTGERSLQKDFDSKRIHQKEVKGDASQCAELDAQSQNCTDDQANISTLQSKPDESIVKETDDEKGEKAPLMGQQENCANLPQRYIFKELKGLQDVLQLTDQDISEGFASRDPITPYVMFKIWREMPRPSVFNYRAELAHELRKIQMSWLADEIISGKFITEKTSLEFVKDVVRRMSKDQQEILKKLLKLSGEGDICENICAWVADWTKEMASSQHTSIFSQVIKTVKKAGNSLPFRETVYQRHRDLNDKLVEHGFLDLAREIMIIEQNLA